MPSGGEPSTEALNLGNGPKTVVPICWDLNGDGLPVSGIFLKMKRGFQSFLVYCEVI